MKPLHSMLGVVILTFGGSCWAANPCMPIADACMKEGYYKGGKNVGKGLVEDCVKPVVLKEKNLTNMTFDDPTLEACKAVLASKMGE